ncbi:transposable element Tcb1 transposase [Trichonephila clavipes]|nr:transposable element Tcb1 transposase [Trichonephila clavipes]
MELSLSASPQAARSGTPQDFATTSLNFTNASYMNLSLPASNHSSRPMTPKDSTSPTKKGTNCRKLQFLAANINLMAEEVETNKKLIQLILNKGHNQDPFLAETMKRLEICIEQHQQAVTDCIIGRHPGTDSSSLEPPVSSRTIQRCLTEGHFGLWRPLNLKWCHTRGNWTTAEWNQVVFSDESRFNFSRDDNRVRMWRPRGECLNPAFALKRHTTPTAGVLIWGAIAYNTRSPLVLILAPSQPRGMSMTSCNHMCCPSCNGF